MKIRQKWNITRNKPTLADFSIFKKEYLSENLNSTVSYSTFLQTRPFLVINRSVEQRLTCLCKTCDNLQLTANIKLQCEKVIVTSDLRRLAPIFCCSSEKCVYMFGSCSTYSPQIFFTHIDRSTCEVTKTWKEKGGEEVGKCSRNQIPEINKCDVCEIWVTGVN